MRGGVARGLWCVFLAAGLAARPAGAVPNPCRAACKAAKKACVQAANAAFVTAKAVCATAPALADRHACKQAARAARATAKATCRANRASCVAACTPGQTTTTTTLPGPSCGDAEAPGVSGITRAHDAVRANPSLDSNGVTQPAPNPPLSPLCYSASVATTAQGWADGCRFMHNAGRGNLGENIYAVTGAAFPTTPTDAVTSWSAEAQYYDYATNSCSAPNPPGTCGHYTQVVWRDTGTVGCGIQVCTTNSPFAGFTTWTFVVCDYQPPGNVSVCDSQGHCVLQLPY